MQEYSYFKRNLNKSYNKGNQGLLYRVITFVICFFLTTVAFNLNDTYGEPEVKTVEVVGTAAVHKTDVDTAKQQAIANGLVSAVDKIVTEILSTEQLTQNFHKLDKTIYSETDKYINDYKVLTEAISKTDYRVLIQAKVSVKRLKNRLQKSGLMQVRKRKFRNIEIVVQDTGNGIEKHELKKIFQPFYTNKIQGIGMGLAVCERIIQNHGGEIRVESEFGHGSEFTIVLPKS